ncbi:hypothetical protein Pan216_18420 [Planctomycetes bacterium Pan216]|uniref:Glycosyl transferase family 28 C-terminal domain-containing protein n=1 Tax=Kolteria novifilia TaxID=2527975 RepID=A0A518B1Y5_9BACT|nr:hypothetical protein Pan216_18420 [Planctomycetes bacterium Pan216]
MAVCYYITAHGLGHSVRSAAVINEIPRSQRVIVRSCVAPVFLEQEIRRPYDLIPERFDCGTVQRDSFHTDVVATFEKYAALEEEWRAKLDEEVDFLKREEVDVIVADVPALPLRAAAKAGIPSIAISNFHWAGIYGSLLEELGPRREEFAPLVDRVREDYISATRWLRLPFSDPMPEFPQCESIPLVAREPTSIRPALAGYHDLDPSRRWAVLYLGQWPSHFDWDRLDEMDDFEFVCLGDGSAPHGRVSVIDPVRFEGQDVIASSDLVIGKAGYGIVADCVSTETPLLYTSRDGFSEHAALDRGLRQWGKALCVDQETFFRNGLRDAMLETLALEVKEPMACDGAKVAAQAILETAGVTT